LIFQVNKENPPGQRYYKNVKANYYSQNYTVNIEISLLFWYHRFDKVIYQKDRSLKKYCSNVQLLQFNFAGEKNVLFDMRKAKILF